MDLDSCPTTPSTLDINALVTTALAIPERDGPLEKIEREIKAQSGEPDIAFENSPVKSGKFRFQATRALLTYRTHIDKEAFIAWFTSSVKKNVIFIRLAHENGKDDPNTPYEHTHVVFELDSIFQTTNQRFFDYEEIHPHISIIKNKKSFDKAKSYIGKEDPDNADLDTRGPSNIVDRVANYDNLKDAINANFGSKGLQLRFTEISGFERIWKLANSKVTDLVVPSKTWQVNLMDETKDPIQNHRKIIWYYDPVGNTGKTELARYLIASDPVKWFCCKDMGTSYHAATIIAGAIDGGWNGHGMILDLPRQAENHERMYTYLEEVKDGFITSQKYAGRTMVFNRPYVIVFANWLPKVRCMSLDRWDIRQFIDGGNIKAVDAYALLQEEEGLVENPPLPTMFGKFLGN